MAERSHGVSGESRLVLVAPPGTNTLAVTPVPSSSRDIMAINASWPALDGP